MPQTVIEKIAERYAVGWPAGQRVRAGNYVKVRPKHVMTHDNTGAVIPKFKSIGATKIFNPRQPVFCIDHDIQNTTPENLAKYAKIAAFAKEHGIDFYPPGSGIGHQIIAEEGYATPDTFVVGSDSHSNLYGALGCIGTPVVRTDAAAIWATGETWWQVPPIVRVELRGRLRAGVVGKDVIIALIGAFNKDEVLNTAIEFVGDGVGALSMDQRMTISNMTTEWGALCGRFPFDDVLEAYLVARARMFAARGDARARFTEADVRAWRAFALAEDAGAEYAKTLALDLSRVVPHVAGPNEVKTIVSVPEIAKRRVPVHKAYLLSCVNSRLEDLAEAAAVLRGKKIAPGVKMYLAAASASVQREAEQLGHWGALLDAGATPLPSGCGPCIGLGEGTVEAGETAISATNRNFKGRMGSREGDAYIASPAVVAASAAAGYITGPGDFSAEPLVAQIVADARANASGAAGASGGGAAARASVEILAGFPSTMRGRLLFLPKDNMNTDGIYGKEYTYKDDMKPDEMAAVTMKNYDPEFQSIAQDGDILVGAYNFGTGSSREQAATALKYRGLQLVVAGSLNQTYQRNAFNNGYITIECPALVEGLKAEFAAPIAAKQLTMRSASDAEIDFALGEIRYGGAAFAFAALSPVAQRLVVAGGAEAVVRQELGIA
ncbi:MAG: homoaconitase [bacterium]